MFPFLKTKMQQHEKDKQILKMEVDVTKKDEENLIQNLEKGKV